MSQENQRVMAAVEDLMFKSKISETAATLGIESAFPRSPAKLLDAARSSPPDILILDLASERFEPLELLRTVSEDEELSGIPTIGFLPHVEKDLARAAKEAGCGKIMARSAFTKELPKIISGEKT
ncbi:hypothetical protein BH24ACT16_BH24ACT16_16140 [soil metagenome]